MLCFARTCGLNRSKIREYKQATSTAESKTNMASPPLRHNGATFKFRRYRDVCDRDEVREICTKVDDYKDYVPRLLPAYASGIQCEPYVLEGPTGVAAFILVRPKEVFLNHDVLFQREFFIGAVRVREDLRGVGLATTILLEATKAVRKAHNELSDLRIFSTTIPENKAMIRIFHKAGWTPVSNMIIWPRKDEIRSIKSTGKSMLESLDLVHKISSESIALASKWRRITESDDISALVTQLGRNGSEFLRPEYFSAEGLQCASHFLTNGLSRREHRSAWRLHCNQHLVGLLFVRPQVLEPASNEPPNIVSACVDDVCVAESAVVFAGNLLKQESFHVCFDAGITAEKMGSSPLFSSVKAAPFIVYEHRH